MNDYRYILEPYRGMKTRHPCPNGCNGKTYTRYLDKQTGKLLPYEYGKCERLNKCSYHLNPYLGGYAKMIWLQERGKEDWREVQLSPVPKVRLNKPQNEQVFIPIGIFQNSLGQYGKNSFVKYLIYLLGRGTALSLAQRFHLGTSKYPERKEACVFWLIDEQSNIVGGQVVAFDENGHTLKKELPNGNKRRFNSWVHVALKKAYQKKKQSIPAWLQKYIDDSPKFPCLFGLPQLKTAPITKPIAIVEAAKTAIIATAYLPQYIWLAIGSLSYLNENRLAALTGRNITLFPDKGGYNHWAQKVNRFSTMANFNISNFLERKGAEAGTDLADYLTRFDLYDFIPKRTETNLEKPEPQNLIKPVIEAEANTQSSNLIKPDNQALPKGWSRNEKDELIDEQGLIVLDWWTTAVIEKATDLETAAIRAEKANQQAKNQLS